MWSCRKITKTDILNFLIKYYKLIIGVLLIVTIFRATEITRLFILGNANISLLKYQFLGLYFDWFSVFVISVYGLPIFLLIYRLLSNNLSKKIIIVIAFIVFLLGELFIEYFNNIFVPLDRALFFYNIKELFFISKASSSVNIYLILFIYIVITLFVIYFTVKLLNRVILTKKHIFILLAISFFAIVFKEHDKPKLEHFDNEINYYNSTNKIIYFIDGVIEWITDKDIYLDSTNLKNTIDKYRNINNEKDFINYNFPYYHKNKYKNVLGKYFNFKDKTPNIVIITVESLSRAISGYNAYYGSFTPFLDSLADESLYWSNFLSNAERTFGVMPNVLGSLPYGKEGFTIKGNKIPFHSSLLKILKTNNYKLNYFYAGWVGFHNTKDFLIRNNVDYILSEDNFGKQYNRMPNGEAGWSWGYGDKELFEKSFEITDTLNENTPRLDVFMTLSTHEPWLIDNQEYYKKLVYKRIKKLGLSKQKKREIKNNINVLSVFMYTDNALREYFRRAKNTKWFNNTIFIITGDHRMAKMEKKSFIDKYHVPLIIYSPLLNNKKEFKGVSCHLDVTPTVLTLLGDKFIKTPNNVHWIGTTLDTSTVFNSNEVFTFMLNNKQVNEIVYKNYYLNNKALFKLNDNFNLNKINNNKLRDSIKEILNIYKQIDLYTVENNVLIPSKDYLQENNSKIIEKNFIDFESNNISNFDKKYITDTTFFSKKHSFILKNSNLYQSVITNPIEFTDTITKALCFFNFMFYYKDVVNVRKLPTLVYELKDEKGNVILWHSDDLSETEGINPEKWIKYTSTLLINMKDYKYKSNSKMKLKIYLYNPNKELIIMDDVNSLVIDITQ